MTQIFISYSRKDLTFIERLAADLEKLGLDVWYDLSALEGGDRWNRAIQQAIQDCQYVVLVLSPEAVESKWVEKEYFFAEKLNKKIIPLYYRDCDLGLAYIDLHYIDVQAEKYQPNFNKILRALDIKPAPVGRVSNPTTSTPPEVSPIKEVRDAPKASQAKSLTYAGMEFMRVPAGKFLMGDEKHPIEIPYDYWMARFPVTNEQYNAYVEAERIIHPIPDWQKKKDHPVVMIDWNTVMEYCRWLNNLFKAELPSGLVLRLPTEAEWEKTARWKLPSTSGRGAGGEGESLEYPWGNEFDSNKCNSRESGKRGTTPVGLYSPQGNSPYGCADMAGNVWEWTHSEYKGYPYDATDGREDEQKSVYRVLRGGSFHAGFGFARCACRDRHDPVNWSGDWGFRVVVSPILPS